MTLNEVGYAVSLIIGGSHLKTQKIINVALERELIECEGASVKILFDYTVMAFPLAIHPHALL